MNLKYRKKSTKTGANFRGGGKNFSGWPEYIPLLQSYPENSVNFTIFCNPFQFPTSPCDLLLEIYVVNCQHYTCVQSTTICSFQWLTKGGKWKILNAHTRFKSTKMPFTRISLIRAQRVYAKG